MTHDERIADLIAGCDQIGNRLGNTVSDKICEDLEQLERLHDNLAREVENLVGLFRLALVALQPEPHHD